MCARQQWVLDYREARTLQRFISTFHKKLTTLPPERRTFPELRGFEATRLHGDILRWVGDGFFSLSVECHRSRLQSLRYQEPGRLP